MRITYGEKCETSKFQPLMSANCWCLHCGGKTVTRNTFVKHGRKNKPDTPPKNDHIDLAMLAPHYNSNSDKQQQLPHHDSDTDVYDPDTSSDTDTDTEGAGKAHLTDREVSLLLMDWMCAHKITDSAAKHIWELVRLFLPETSSVPNLGQVE